MCSLEPLVVIMIKEYKNKIFETLRDSNLFFDYFDILKLEDEQLETHIITYKNTPFRFTIRQDEYSFDFFDFCYTEFAPGFPDSDIYPENSYATFEVVLQSVLLWIKSINRYLDDQEEIDLWREFKKGNATLNIENIQFEDRVDFSKDEKIQVKMAINEFRNLISHNFELTSAENSIITERLKYLIEAVERSNKFDWKGIAVSTLMSISVALSLDTEKGTLLFELFKKVFSAIKLIMP